MRTPACNSCIGPAIHALQTYRRFAGPLHWLWKGKFTIHELGNAVCSITHIHALRPGTLLESSTSGTSPPLHGLWAACSPKQTQLSCSRCVPLRASQQVLRQPQSPWQRGPMLGQPCIGPNWPSLPPAATRWACLLLPAFMPALVEHRHAARDTSCSRLPEHGQGAAGVCGDLPRQGLSPHVSSAACGPAQPAAAAEFSAQLRRYRSSPRR